MAGDREDRTEQASARRLQKAREQGDVAISRELSLLAGLAGGAGVVAVQIAAAGNAPVAWFARMLARSGGGTAGALAEAGRTILEVAAPAALGATAAVAGAIVMQTGFLLRAEVLQPDLARISPGRGIARLFSVETLLHSAKSLIKLAVLMACLWMELRRLVPVLALTARWPPAEVLGLLVREAARLLLLLAGLQAALAAADVFIVHLRHAAKHRMTRQEQRDEHKETEGNPQVKQAQRRIARQRARRRMIAAVRTATVVVVNPEHYAVALAYTRGSSGAPKLVAKGLDELAERIRREARDCNIPIVANPPLARALYRIEIDTEIPVEHFRAVAEIIAYIWRLRARPRL